MSQSRQYMGEFKRQNVEIFWGNVCVGVGDKEMELYECNNSSRAAVNTGKFHSLQRSPVSSPAATNNRVSMVKFQSSEGGAKDTPDFMGF